ncbi:Ditrans,polycis-undecaprenyl-diphosphate synthase ((2E,6E)-farnesyl-diphosphate specific) [invertebrate metagenome]|uniref:Ditrans,polycis-undecaprenyl-diphosphate synthase ((2E,6E)-farnesyl-diphosphate specific) n=1 Tax=invertebrate metagenome TaxID=1711999 RepID=A0A2H9T6S0_9ZZZZ
MPETPEFTHLNKTHLPHHIAVIMDGNNRWAKKRLLPRLSGHRAAVKAVKQSIRSCRELGINHLTLFAFSSENWNRPPEEVKGLMKLFLHSLKHYTNTLLKHDICLHIIGERSRLTPDIQTAISKTEKRTAHCHSMHLNVAMNYGGRWDITQACQKLLIQMAEGTLNTSDISEALLEQHLCTQNLPAVDLLIRSSGEQRISNFLLWQCSESELYFTPCLWPDFSQEELIKAIESWQKR